MFPTLYHVLDSRLQFCVSILQFQLTLKIFIVFNDYWLSFQIHVPQSGIWIDKNRATGRRWFSWCKYYDLRFQLIPMTSSLISNCSARGAHGTWHSRSSITTRSMSIPVRWCHCRHRSVYRTSRPITSESMMPIGIHPLQRSRVWLHYEIVSNTATLLP